MIKNSLQTINKVDSIQEQSNKNKLRLRITKISIPSSGLYLNITYMKNNRKISHSVPIGKCEIKNNILFVPAHEFEKFLK